jgi:uncharacterized protein YndB with AHSA1/START domain
MVRKYHANELYLTRYYDAPVHSVWDAWVDPAQAAHWWGPRGFSITTHSKDLRVGGQWSYTMLGPDGTDYPNKTTYLEVEEGVKLVYDHGGNDDRPAIFRVTVLFSEVAGKTVMDMTMSFASEVIAKQTQQFIKAAGGDATWDRLGEYLAKKLSGKEVFFIHRELDAPREKVFDVWTDPQHVVQWLAPKGLNMVFIEADIRTGGKSFYRMGNESFMMYGRAAYQQVIRPQTVIYTQQFCDKDGKVARHPMSPTWPETMLTQINFTALEAKRTLVTVRSELSGAVTPEEMDTFVQGRSSMTQGWTGSCDMLETYLTHANI